MKKISLRIKLFILTFRTKDKVMAVLFILSLIYQFLYKSGAFPVFDYAFFTAFGEIVSDITVALLTGLIFIYVVETRYRYKKTISLFRIINNSSTLISKRSRYLINEICKSSSLHQDKKIIYNKQFEEICSTINIHKVTNVSSWIYESTIFYHFVSNVCKDIERNVDTLLGFTDSLDSEWLKYLSKIKDDLSKAFTLIDVNKEHSNLTLISDSLWDMYYQSQCLERITNEFYNKNFEHVKLHDPVAKRRLDLVSFVVGKYHP